MVKDEIKDGRIIGTTLLKPISLYKRAFATDAGWHIVTVFIGLAASLLVGLLLRDYVVFPFTPEGFLLVTLVALLSIFVVFGFSLCLGLLAFWFTEVSTIDNLFWACLVFLGGQALPITFIPAVFQNLVRILPFRYMFSFPLEIFFGKLSTGEIITGLFFQLTWIVILIFLYKIMWRQGLKVYSAFG